MLPRVNPIMLLGLIVALVLSIAILASAKTGGGSQGDATGGGSPGDALAAATGQVGAPYGFGTDGGGSFSCTGLARFALRSAGVDANAPWDHMAYLSAYPTRDTPVPGDVVVYPDGVAMYVGDNTVVMANEVDQVVGYYPMDQVGTPLGFANPYGGTLDPAAVDSAMPIDETVVDQEIPADQVAVDPIMDDPALVDPLAVDPAFVDPAFVDPTVVEPIVEEPIMDDPALVDPMMF